MSVCWFLRSVLQDILCKKYVVAFTRIVGGMIRSEGEERYEGLIM